MPNILFNKKALARVRQTLWHLARGEAKNPAQIDYLVKMNLPPMLGRRNAIMAEASRLLKCDLFAIPDLERHGILISIGVLLDEAIANTEAITVTLSNADTLARERQLITFMEMLRDLVDSAARLTIFGDSLAKDNRAMTKFLGSDFNRTFNKNRSNLNNCELHIVTCAQEMMRDAEPAIKRYWEYTVGSFNAHNAQRYRNAFDRAASFYLGVSLDKPSPPEGW
ncbi:MAG: hypothetical protein AB7F40_10805 [Victivallaceae bacterium]|nr:hypothetical protein [Victivallaceae bacterium]